MQPVSGLFFDFRLLLFQLLDDTALLYGAPDGQRVVHGGFLTAVDTETGKGTCRDVLCGIGYDLPVECRGGGFPFPDDGQAERRDKVLAVGIGVYLVQEVPRPSPGEVVIPVMDKPEPFSQFLYAVELSCGDDSGNVVDFAYGGQHAADVSPTVAACRTGMQGFA